MFPLMHLVQYTYPQDPHHRTRITHTSMLQNCVYRHLPVLVRFLCKCRLLTDQHCLVCIYGWDSVSEVCYRRGGEEREGEKRGGEGRGGEERYIVFHFVCTLVCCVPFTGIYIEARGKSHFSFLDCILKLVLDLFPYAILLH